MFCTFNKICNFFLQLQGHTHCHMKNRVISKKPFLKKYIILPNAIWMKELTVTIKSVFDIMTPVTQLFDLYLFLHQRVFLHYLHSLLVSKNNEQQGPKLRGRYGGCSCQLKISKLTNV